MNANNTSRRSNQICYQHILEGCFEKTADIHVNKIKKKTEIPVLRLTASDPQNFPGRYPHLIKVSKATKLCWI